MTYKEQLSFIKKRFKDKHNVIFTIVFTLLIFVIFGCVIIMNFAIDGKASSANEDLTYRMILTNMPTEEIEKMNNIEYYTSEKYKTDLWDYVSEFDADISKGFVSLLPLLDNIELNIVNGRALENPGEAICPEKFYPHSYFDDNKLYPSLYLKGKNIINKSFNIRSLNEDNLNENSSFKIVGTYKNKKFVEMDACYISKSDFDKNQSKYKFKDFDTDDNGNRITKYVEYSDNIIFVDKYKNLQKVSFEIQEKGYTVNTAKFDETFLRLLFYIPCFIGLIVMILCVNIMFSFIAKKSMYRSKDFGILRSIGYHKKTIIKIELLENIMICVINFILAGVLMFIGYFICSYVFLKEYTYYNYYMPIPILYIVLMSIFILALIVVMTIISTKRILKMNLTEILKAGDKNGL